MNISASEFVKQYCKKSGITEREFYETQVPMPDPTSPYGWAAVSNNPLSIKAHVDLYSGKPPAPVVPDERDKTVDADDHPLLWSFNEGWNACRAAMLEQQLVDRVDEKSLTSINPAPDLVSLQKKAESIIGNYPGIPDCWCRTCRPVVLNDMRFVVCPDCGNKRCPRANDHRNACTGSNEPGQDGSAYPAAPQEVPDGK